MTPLIVFRTYFFFTAQITTDVSQMTNSLNSKPNNCIKKDLFKNIISYFFQKQMFS